MKVLASCNENALHFDKIPDKLVGGLHDLSLSVSKRLLYQEIETYHRPLLQPVLIIAESGTFSYA
jgi:hypothetical protein